MPSAPRAARLRTSAGGSASTALPYATSRTRRVATVVGGDGALALFLMESEQRFHQFLFSARHHRQHLGLLAILRGEIGVAHARIDIQRFPRSQCDRIVEFGVHHDLPAQDIEKFLARVTDKV